MAFFPSVEATPVPPGKWRPVRRSALDYQHRALGATWTVEAGWEVPEFYTSPEVEVAKAQAGAGLADVSSLVKLTVKGEQLEAALGGSGLLPAVGRTALTSIAGVEARLCRLAADEALILGRASTGEALWRTLQSTLEQAGLCAHLTNLTSALAALRLLGPQAATILAALTALDLRPSRFPDGACAQGPLARVHAFLLRVDVQALPSYILAVDRDLGEYVWDAVIDAGREVPLTPLGRAALASLGATI